MPAPQINIEELLRSTQTVSEHGVIRPDDIRQYLDTYSLKSNVPMKFTSVTFENTESPLADRIKDFALNGKGVLIMQGGNGTGKTRLACCAINERILSQINGGRYISCFYEVCPLIRSSRSFRAEKNEVQVLNDFFTTPFLVLDEVGKGDDSVISKMFVSTVLAARYDNELPTLITTNLEKQEFIEFVGKDIESRLHEIATMWTLDGQDRRAR